jgi:hypothetical protein
LDDIGPIWVRLGIELDFFGDRIHPQQVDLDRRAALHFAIHLM